MDEFVNVSVRIRPPLKEEETSSCLQVINKQPAVLLVPEKPHMYHFDNIFTDDVEQIEVYDNTVKKLVEKVKLGYNCTVFAYGQTGTGKTYTIGTNPDVRSDNEMGLIARTLEDFFVFDDEQTDFEIAISFIEIYNEKVFDLLESENSKIPLSVKGFTVQGCRKITVTSSFEAKEYLKSGGRKRHFGETKQNLNSSRSHAIFSIYCSTRTSETETRAKLNLVDLAGCESVRKTGNQGSSFQEGVNINKGLLSLGQVMTALSNNSSHVPYRQSVITTILHDSLNKKNFILLIACVSPNSEDMWETVQTLEFSNRVKKLKNKPEVNEFMVQYKKNNSVLFTKGQTPIKRTNGFSYETPLKKPKMPVIREPVLLEHSNFNISPLCSSSMTSLGGEHQQNFSPVIRKYMNAMESSIMAKFKDVIESTLKKSKNVSKNKENMMTPRISCYDDYNNSEEKSFVTSSPDDEPVNRNHVQAKDDRQSLKPKKLYLDSSDHDETLTNLNEFVFKVPEPKLTKVTKRPRRSSTNKTKTPNLENRRRSVRLQQKSNQPESSPAEKNSQILSTTRRKSIRLQLKAVSATPETKTKRKSKRLDPILCVNCVKKTPQVSKGSTDSPMTARTKQVLNILNDGTLREIEKLHTVGAKTAEKIVLFRELKGCFTTLSDIVEMPSFSRKKYEKFVAENFLRG